MRSPLAVIAMMAFLSACNSATLDRDGSNATIGADSRASSGTASTLVIPDDSNDGGSTNRDIIKLGDPLWGDEELSPNSSGSVNQ